MYLPALNRVLCSNRVSQMTKTYNDIEAVTRLLEEKEKDIELTARIGKELLAHNQKLESNVASLESELRLANEKITQLLHELTKKTELIQILTNDVEESGSEPSTPVGQINWDVLQQRISRLEEENVSLRKEATQLATATEDCEAEERRLMNDLSHQLSLVRGDLSTVASDADKWRDEARHHKALSDSLQERLTVSEQKLNKITGENEELSCMVTLSRETQSELALELAELKERYQEVLSALQEAQEGLRRVRKKATPQARAGPLFPSLHHPPPTALPHDSLASELECSLFSELSLDSGIGIGSAGGASAGSVSSYRKVFETVRCASQSGSLGGSTAGSSPIPPAMLSGMGGGMSSGRAYLSQGGGGTTTLSSATSLQHTRMSSFTLPPARTHSHTHRPRLDSVGASDSECSDDLNTYTGMGVGQSSGTPASNDIEAALRRLTPSAIMARRAALGCELPQLGDAAADSRTPDSIMSTGSSSRTGSSLTSWKMPDKLQIVKPMEGSLTLHQWSQLATPSLGGLLDDNPRVRVRGGTQLEALGLATYSLSDLEEDDEVLHPGKSFQFTGHVTTLTNSTVMHPDDTTSVTPSIVGSQMCSAMSSRMSSRVSSAIPTPATRSRRNSTTSTYSTALGLAKMLNERGIKAATPSALGSPLYSPTATPANSPHHSPTHSPQRSRSPSPTPPPSYSSPLGLPGFLMSSGAELLRKTLVGTHNTKQQRRSRQRTTSRALVCQNKKTNIGLVETLERIGLESIMSSTPSANNPAMLQGVLTERTQSSRCPPVDIAPSLSSVASLGVPGRPGTSALKSRLTQPAEPSGGGAKVRRTRPDLGTVRGAAANDKQHSQSSLGTLSSMLFGRKGGLL